MTRAERRRQEVAESGASRHGGVLTPLRLGPEPNEVSDTKPAPRLLEALAKLEQDDPAAARGLATLHIAASDFLRVIEALPDDLPAEFRLALDALLERL